MKISIKNILLLLSAPVLLLSCNGKVTTGVSTIPFVENLLNDSIYVSTSLISTFNPSTKGAVTIIGPAERCFSLSERFMSFDVFDNVDGKAVPDQLPDFAGETIASIIDYANAPYEKYIDSNNSKFLRELFVRNVLMSMQSGCALGPYDNDNCMEKVPAKVLIIASELYHDYGMHDVDTLLSSSGKNLPVIVAEDPLYDSLVVADCFKLLRKDNLFSHKVAYPSAAGYITYPSSGLPDSAYDPATGAFTDEYKYSRAENSDVKTYTLVGFSPRYLSPHLDSLLQSSAPQTYRSYVQN